MIPIPTKILIDKNFPTKVFLFAKIIIKVDPMKEKNNVGILFGLNL